MMESPVKVWVEQEFAIGDESGRHIRYNAHSWNPTDWAGTFVEYIRADKPSCWTECDYHRDEIARLRQEIERLKEATKRLTERRADDDSMRAEA